MTKTLRVNNRRRSWGGAGEAPQAYPRISFKKWTVEDLADRILLDYQVRQFYPQTIRTKYKARPGIVTKALLMLQRQGKVGRTNDAFERPSGRTIYWVCKP